MCPTGDSDILAEQDDENCEDDQLSADAQAAEGWAPNPEEPTDFKATFVATERAHIEQPHVQEKEEGLNTTWLTLGILVAFCVGVVLYLVRAG